MRCEAGLTHPEQHGYAVGNTWGIMSGKTAKAQRKTEAETATTAGLSMMSEREVAEFKIDYDAQQLRHADWDEKEAILLTKPADQISKQFNSKMTDGRLSTIVIERAARVMAQLPTGVVRALTKKNKGLAAIMSFFLTKYIQVRDKMQYDHLTKLRMVDMYSQVYGVMPVLYDLSVTEKYLGPSSRILPIRSWYPQVGKVSIDDSNRNHVEVFVSASDVEGWKGRGSWDTKVLEYVLAKAKEGGSSPSEVDNNQRSVRERDVTPNVDGGKGDSALIRVVTRYEQGEAGRWKTFFPDYENVMGRNIQSRDGNIPIVLKHHIPLIDDIYGLGAFERGKTIQFAMDSLVAMYMAGVQMSIFPPRIVKKGKVVLSSLKYGPGETWIETDPDYVRDAIRNYNVSPEGLQTFQSTMGWLTGSLLNQNGSTDTSQTVKATSDPSSGKTPEALKQQAARESAADAWDRSMMEVFLQTLYERMINIAPKTPKPFSFHLFDDEIKQIKDAGMADVMDVFDSDKEAVVTLAKDKMVGPIYKFFIDSGTTMQSDQQSEHQVYDAMLERFTTAPQLIQAAAADGYQVHVGEIIHQYFVTGGAKDPEKLISKVEQAQAAIDGQAGQPALPAQAGAAPAPGAPDGANMAQIMSGQPAPTPPPVEQPDPLKDPTHDFIKTHFKSFPASTQRAILIANNLPSEGLLPTEAEMIKNLSQPSQYDEQGITEDLQIIETDPNSPYGAAKNPVEHLQGSKDPAVQNLFKHIMSSGQPGVPIEATPAVDPATGQPVQDAKVPAGVA